MEKNHPDFLIVILQNAAADLKDFSLLVNSFKDSYSLGGLTKFLEIKASKG